MRSAIIAAAAVAALAGCSSYDSVTQRIAQSITPYRITVVQGNFVSQEKAAQLQAGMTREQVRALLGTPLLADMFHADRWDYLFYFKRGSTSVVQQRDLVLTFASDRLASWTGADNLPSELDLLADIDGDRGGKKAKAAAEAKRAAEAAAAASAAQAAEAASPSTGLASGAVVDQDANAQAARAANRATNQVSGQGSASRRFTPSAQASGGAPVPGGQPPGAAPAIQPQFQFHRPPQPNASNEAAPPVGPQGSDNLQNQPLTAPAQ
ncbi:MULTISPECIES: outer membrane protein assembly factor BamE [Burkholderia]|jgi:outer membrane protein assembly factor BamE|uniref:outer membrane protein assembly factor BamE n=1 Tax=Burkholderia TaxID=32008 RepID=UPI000D001549|nr:outer membrane protein assembly factor BamE [Burkholderia ambifaria]MDP9586212.1 outer membrane protein assembly factor BamE [Burkholderia contaminans]MBR8186012.1 outer membrane protein assembly factor BamE [Burkholderia ambifaria]MBR8331583.1 outer membrane protein assembly factor BamE [Burkholderia ambifaria]MBR8345395.1 outer membrane protein assembly factor BamE [Burkholderia ambifaria]PRF96065.1 outer membrane protein assembly factor BamE [Burkholderia ambifaria]